MATGLGHYRAKGFVGNRAKMAGGWSRDGDVQQQIDASVDDAVRRARSELGAGASARFCDECGEAIPEARRMALPGVRRCVPCQEEKDARADARPGLNRRASKDSLLR